MMILHKLRTVNRIQQGFTLVEILVAIAVTGVIGAAVGTLAFQTVNINASNTNRQIAITQVENAVHYVSRDTQQAQYIIPTDITDIALVVDPITNEVSFDLVAGDKLALTWIAWDNTKNEILYTVVSGTLQKTTTINSSFISTVNIADNMSIASGTWNVNTKVCSFQIEATVGVGRSQKAESRTFQIIPRSVQ